MLVSRRTIQLLAIAALLFLQACSETDRGPIFDPLVGHPGNWTSDHGQAALDEGNTCPECHGTDLGGGASQLSCFTTQHEGVGCHEDSAGQRHTTGWALESEHGQAAKERPGVSSGMGSCQACHGDDYSGGSSEISCTSCHDVPAPHPPAPWLGTRNSHDTVDEQNSPVCFECHENPESFEPAGCFNGSLCHTERAAHPADWASPGQHGENAKGDPDTGGFEKCQDCHGTGFAGGTSEVACSECHDIAAPHPSFGWAEGGESHRSVDGENAKVCAECHAELEDPPDCFVANGCHVGGTESPPPEETPPADQGPDGPAPPQDSGGDTAE